MLYGNPSAISTRVTQISSMAGSAVPSAARVATTSKGLAEERLMRIWSEWFFSIFYLLIGLNYSCWVENLTLSPQPHSYALALSLQQQEEDAHRAEQARWSNQRSRTQQAPPPPAAQRGRSWGQAVTAASSTTMVDAMGTVVVQERTAAEKVAVQARERQRELESNKRTEETARKKEKRGNDCVIS
ncbi:hypothetical protein BC937DRAFT_86511 [Endogone sp. FLAS-F59071]|nr:hypothetical protein BC937DRAFT_86511 [Endogone sp. FLAS-F59071]|eukprot:RUS13001.1 hypothetical protein BC937DRAFT_86511 [Endogone sp. FLAS-F59071]